MVETTATTDAEVKATAERLQWPVLLYAAARISALSAEVERANARAEGQWEGWIKADVERRTAERQVADLKAALGALIVGYVGLLELGRDRIVALGGKCDPVDVMDAGDPHLREARAALSPTPASETSDRAEENKRLREALEDARDNGLIYWEPRTDRGHVTKAQMLARIDAALSRLSSEAVSKEEWREISTAPKNATEVLLRVPKDGWPGFRAVVGHWAEDLSGSEQPAFRGWFWDTGYGFAGVSPNPTHWLPLPDLRSEAVSKDQANG